MTKPNGDTITKTSDSCSQQTFEGTETSTTGNYEFRCKVTDNVGLSTTSSAVTVTINTAGGGGSGGGGGSSYDADFTVQDTTEVTGSKYTVRTFTFGGQDHKIVFEDVTRTSVDIRIESEPQFITLNIGESHAVDLNKDGKFDMQITLLSIQQGQANLELEKFLEGSQQLLQEELAELEKEIGPTAAAVIQEEEIKDQGPTQPTLQPTLQAPAYSVQLISWLITAGVIVLVILGYLVIHKKENR